MDDGRIRLGMVGGGEGAFIGAVHRIAARLDDRFRLVAGCFGSTPERSAAFGAALGLPPDRVHGTAARMALAESRRADGVQAVAVVTPNHLHLDHARPFLARGIHVICDKPLAATLPQARAMARAARESRALFVLTHTYAGYAMVRQAREMVAAGMLGDLRIVQVEYAQDWLTDPVESTGNRQAEWRTDPARAGIGGALGDIGTHAFHLAGFVTGHEPEALAADLSSFGPGRRLDDNAHVLLRYAGGARGMLWASQVAPGAGNGLRLRVFGSRGGIAWAQEDPEVLWHTPHGEPTRRLVRGGPGTGAAAARVSRVPAGHPEGYLEAFANLYADAADAIRAQEAGLPLPEPSLPGLEDGLRGMEFVAACVRSRGRWVRLAP